MDEYELAPGTNLNHLTEYGIYVSKKVNLLDETESILAENGKTWEDVFYVYDARSGKGYHIEEFIEKAREIDYEPYAHSVAINPEIIIVGYDWWLSRDWYSACGEWWRYFEMPKKKEWAKENDLELYDIF